MEKKNEKKLTLQEEVNQATAVLKSTIDNINAELKVLNHTMETSPSHLKAGILQTINYHLGRLAAFQGVHSILSKLVKPTTVEEKKPEEPKQEKKDA